MHCAGCGQRLDQRQDGAYPQCCDGIGYWYLSDPLPIDGTWRRHFGRWRLYLSAKWPPGRIAVPPIRPPDER